MQYERIKLDIENSIAVLVLNHPKVMNAVCGQMLEELDDCLHEIRNRGNEVRCILITGEGRAFCAGANLADEKRNTERRMLGAGDGLRKRYHPIFNLLKDMDMPIVTAVNGAAAGVGMSLALMGDIVCAARTAFFFQAFANIGLIPDGGSTFMLPRLIGWGRALELSLLAERLPAEKALEWGLINRVFDDEELMSGAFAIANRIASGPRSLGFIRKAYWQTWDNSYESQLVLESHLQDAAGNTKDSKEGIKAFQEKRKPKFSGE